MNTPRYLILTLSAASLICTAQVAHAQSTPEAALPTEPTTTGGPALPAPAGPIESNLVKSIAVEPVVSAPAPTTSATPTTANPVDLTARGRPLAPNTASLRNEKAALTSGKAERPARADRN